MARAISSLPVPDSPVTSTAGVGRGDQLDLARGSSGSHRQRPMISAMVALQLPSPPGDRRSRAPAARAAARPRRARRAAAPRPSWRSLTSRKTITAPTSRPRSRIGVEVYSTQKPVPSLREELLVLDTVHRAVAEGGVDRALLMRVVRCRPAGGDAPWRACRGRPARPSRQPSMRLGGGVDEGRLALGIDAEDALAGRAQDELVAALDLLEQAFGAQPFGDCRRADRPRPRPSSSRLWRMSRS